MDNFKYGLLATLRILKDYLSDIVIGGGWAPLLYYHYLLGDKTKRSILTRDIDFMVKTRLPVRGAKTVDQLLTDAGFTAIFKSRDTPPVIHYEGMIHGHEINDHLVGRRFRRFKPTSPWQFSAT